MFSENNSNACVNLYSTNNNCFRFRRIRRHFIERVATLRVPLPVVGEIINPCPRVLLGAVKRGKNEFTRSSLESSVTIPHEITYRNLDGNRTVTSSNEQAAFNFCGCGWPQNMLIAKGSPEGFPCQLFVMVSNGANDQVRATHTATTIVAYG